MTHAETALSTILPSPRPTATPTIEYHPVIHSTGGAFYPDRRLSDLTKATIVADIASAQHDDVVRVIAFDVEAGTCWDASREIAQAVLDVILTDYSRVPAWCEDFLERHLGIHNVREAEYEYRHAA